MKNIASRQRGVSLSGLIIWVVVLILGGIFAMKLIPAYVQNAEIKDIFDTIAEIGIAMQLSEKEWSDLRPT